MIIEPRSLQECGARMLGSRDSNTTSISAAVFGALAREWLIHIPFGAGIEEGQSVPSLQWSIVGNPDLELAHVEHQGWTARMVAEDEVGVEFDAAAVAVILNGGPGWSLAWCCGRDLCEQGASGERD
ncbi:MAG: hypothetical protein Q9195_002228 [Heterodermia aff. obscurata]